MNPLENNLMDVPSEIMVKMERFCAFQERCGSDVRRKLTSFHLSESQKNAVLNSLKENGFLDEARYVESFVRGKVRSSWGRQKIVAALRAKGIPAELIDQACADISVDDYQEKLREAIAKWRRSHPDEAANSPKLVRHLLSKGFRVEEALEAVSSWQLVVGS